MLLPTPTKYSFKDLGISAISSKFIPTLDQLGLGWPVLKEEIEEVELEEQQQNSQLYGNY